MTNKPDERFERTWSIDEETGDILTTPVVSPLAPSREEIFKIFHSAGALDEESSLRSEELAVLLVASRHGLPATRDLVDEYRQMVIDLEAGSSPTTVANFEDDPVFEKRVRAAIKELSA